MNCRKPRITCSGSSCCGSKSWWTASRRRTEEPALCPLNCAIRVPIGGEPSATAEHLLSLPSSGLDRESEPDPVSAVVYRGPKMLCQEFSLVLEAKAIEHTVQESGDSCIVAVAPALAHQAYDEISRYSAERSAPRRLPVRFEPYSGAAIGAAG